MKSPAAILNLSNQMRRLTIVMTILSQDLSIGMGMYQCHFVQVCEVDYVMIREMADTIKLEKTTNFILIY